MSVKIWVLMCSVFLLSCAQVGQNRAKTGATNEILVFHIINTMNENQIEDGYKDGVSTMVFNWLALSNDYRLTITINANIVYLNDDPSEGISKAAMYRLNNPFVCQINLDDIKEKSKTAGVRFDREFFKRVPNPKGRLVTPEEGYNWLNNDVIRDKLWDFCQK